MMHFYLLVGSSSSTYFLHSGTTWIIREMAAALILYEATHVKDVIVFFRGTQNIKKPGTPKL